MTERLTPRELFHRVMTFSAPGTTLATLGGIWQSTRDRWIAEGMPAELTDIQKMWDYFGLDPHLWAQPEVELLVYPRFERRVLAETEDKVTYVNDMGVTCTEFRTDAYKSMPHFEAFPIQGRRDWEAFRERLVWTPERVGEAWEKQKAGWEGRTAPLILALNHAASLYGTLRNLCGVERLSYLFYDDRPLVEEMMDTMLALFLPLCDALFGGSATPHRREARGIGEGRGTSPRPTAHRRDAGATGRAGYVAPALQHFTPDAVCLWEDMAYKTGSLLSARHVRAMMLPRYRVMTAKLREKGIPFIFLDSDGYIDELIPIWLEAGIDGLVPMEANAGMDVALYRERYPRLLMMGGVDKRALHFGREAIDHEIDKLRRTIASGGLVPFFDHGLPHDASYGNFLYFVERLKEVTGRGN
jgi:uroporphyrinogen decarboxylase